MGDLPVAWWDDHYNMCPTTFTKQGRAGENVANVRNNLRGCNGCTSILLGLVYPSFLLNIC